MTFTDLKKSMYSPTYGIKKSISDTISNNVSDIECLIWNIWSHFYCINHSSLARRHELQWKILFQNLKNSMYSSSYVFKWHKSFIFGNHFNDSDIRGLCQKNAAILLIEYLIVDMTNKKIIFYTKKCHHELWMAISGKNIQSLYHFKEWQWHRKADMKKIKPILLSILFYIS